MQININKIASSREINLDDVPQQAKDFILAYGLRQLVNDCHASIQRKDFNSDGDFMAAVESTVDGKIAQIMSGDLSTRRGSSEPIDPVERIALRLAKDSVKAALAAKGIKPKQLAEGKFDELAGAYLEKNGDNLRKLAKAELKRKADMVADIDLESLLG